MREVFENYIEQKKIARYEKRMIVLFVVFVVLGAVLSLGAL